MEVGAVKQAFNNEIILLKKNLNQAKIQIINKLTRKAKTLTEKKTLEHCKEKLKKKAEYAVREVLIIKKIKPKELAKFIVTHTGQLQQYLNRPQVDQDKACARLLLHKALQEKYKLIRTRFSDVPIKDLFMSRQERLKLKKEAREQKKNKKNKKGDKVVNAQGDWEVENVKTANKLDDEEISHEDDEHMSSDESQGDISEGNELEGKEDEENNFEGSEDDNKEPDSDESQHEDKTEASGNNNEAEKFIKLKPIQESKNKKKQKVSELETISEKDTLGKDIEMKFKLLEKEIKKKQNKKAKDVNKNKNLNEKLLSRKFKKDSDEITEKETKVVDPFFITSSGENYLSVAEPRQPDEVKEEHKQGNRQIRRAAMLGHFPKFKPRQNYHEHNDSYNKQNSYGNRPNDRYEKQNGFQKERFNDDRFNKQNGNGGPKHNYANRNSEFKSVQEESKPEKLHPSWEAKKKQSGILPFEGKKIVFSED